MASTFDQKQRDYERRIAADVRALDPGAVFKRSQNLLIPEYWIVKLSSGTVAAGTSFEEAASFALRHLREIRDLTNKLIR